MFAIAIYRYFSESVWISGVTLGYSGYIIGIMLFSLLQVIILDSTAKKYRKLELRCRHVDDLKNASSRFQREKNNSEGKHYTKLKSYEEYSYIVMRDLFVNPSHFPKFHQNHLPYYFDFSMYLGFALDNTLAKFLQPSIATFFVLLVFISIWPMILTLNITVQVLLLTSFI